MQAGLMLLQNTLKLTMSPKSPRIDKAIVLDIISPRMNNFLKIIKIEHFFKKPNFKWPKFYNITFQRPYLKSNIWKKMLEPYNISKQQCKPF